MATEIPTFDDKVTNGKGQEEGEWECNKCIPARRFKTQIGLTLHSLRMHEGRNWSTKVKNKPREKNGKAPRLNRSMKGAIVELFKQGKSREQVANKLGISYGRVCEYLRKRGMGWGYGRRLQKRTANMKSSPSRKAFKVAIINMFKQGYDRYEIAKKLGYGYSTVANYLSANGYHEKRPYRQKPVHYLLNRNPQPHYTTPKPTALAPLKVTGHYLGSVLKDLASEKELIMRNIGEMEAKLEKINRAMKVLEGKE